MTEHVIKAPAVSETIGKKYANKWIALSTDYKKVIAFGKNLVDVDREVGDRKAIFARVLPDGFLAPTTFTI